MRSDTDRLATREQAHLEPMRSVAVEYLVVAADGVRRLDVDERRARRVARHHVRLARVVEHGDERVDGARVARLLAVQSGRLLVAAVAALIVIVEAGDCVRVAYGLQEVAHQQRCDECSCLCPVAAAPCGWSRADTLNEYKGLHRLNN